MNARLLDNLSLGQEDLYRLDGPINFLHLESLYSSAEFPRLKDKPFQPVMARALAGGIDAWKKAGGPVLHA